MRISWHCGQARRTLRESSYGGTSEPNCAPGLATTERRPLHRQKAAGTYSTKIFADGELYHLFIAALLFPPHEEKLLRYCYCDILAIVEGHTTVSTLTAHDFCALHVHFMCTSPRARVGMDAKPRGKRPFLAYARKETGFSVHIRPRTLQKLLPLTQAKPNERVNWRACILCGVVYIRSSSSW